MSQDDSQSERISELAREFLELCRTGQRPPLSDYTEKHPELADQIREVFPMMLLMEEIAPESGGTNKPPIGIELKRLGDFTIHRVIGRGGMGLVYEATQESLGRRVALKVCPINSLQLSGVNQERFRRESRAAAMLHHTNIVPVFAVGEEEGMLYYAMQYIEGATLDDVIQELDLLWRNKPTSTTRLSEAAITRNTNSERAATQVAQSLAADDFTDGNFHAANSTQQQSTDEASRRVSLPGQSPRDTSGGAKTRYWESVARIGVQIADALSYAHGRGTLHRDIKPGNVMLDQSGTIWLMDFGLAKSLEEDDLTRDGELIGTLRYMAPEQCLGNPGPASDIYSLGLTLYELLTLRPAYEELHRSELLRAISERDPASPRRYNAGIPKDLETITMKCLEREPNQRYGSAKALLDDLNRFLANEPILARPVSSTERALKWARRRPMIASLLATLLILISASFAIISWKWRDAENSRKLAQNKELLAQLAAHAERQARANADAQTRLAQERLEETQDALYRTAVSRIEAGSDSAPDTAKRLLTRWIPKSGESDRRGWEWGYLNALVNQEVLTLQGGAPQANWIRALAFSHDERYLAVGSARPGFIHPIGISPRGRVTVWDLSKAQLVAELPIEHSCRALAFSRDNRRLAISEPRATHHMESNWAGAVRVWDLDTLKPELELKSSDGRNIGEAGVRATTLHFGPDDNQIFGTIWATSLQPLRVACWNSETGEELWSIPKAQFLDFSTDASSFYVSSFDSMQLEQYDVQSGNLLAVVPGKVNHGVARHCPRTGAIAQTYGGRLQVGLPDKELRMFFGDDNSHVTNDWPNQPVVAFHPSKRRLASGTTNGDIRIWQTDLGVSERILRGHSVDVQCLTYSKSGRWLASGDWQGVVRVWEPEHWRHRVRCQPRDQLDTCFIEAHSFRHDSSNLVAYSHYKGLQSKLTSWEVEQGWLVEDHLLPAKSRLSEGFDKRFRQACFSGDGERLLTLESGLLKVFETGTRRLLAQQSAPETTIEVAWDHSGTALASLHQISSPGDSCHAVHLWQMQTGTVGQEAALKNPRPPLPLSQTHRREYPRSEHIKLAMAPNGKRLAIGISGPEGYCRLEVLNTDSGKVITSTPTLNTQLGSLSALEFSPDECRLAVAIDQGELLILDVDTGLVLHSNRSIRLGVDDLAWHPDGKRFAGVDREAVTLWDDHCRELLKLPSDYRTGDLPFDPCLTFSPDGTKLAATQWDNQINIWTVYTPTASVTAPPILNSAPSSSQRSLNRLEASLETEPDNPWLLATRGYMHSQAGLKEEAQEDYLAAKQLLSSDGNCLLIDSHAYIQAPSLPLSTEKGYTIEAWVKHWNNLQNGSPCGVIAAQYPKGPEDYYRYLAHQSSPDLDRSGFYWLYCPHNDKHVSASWSHIAVTVGDSSKSYFLNGRMIRRQSRGKGKLSRDLSEMTDFYIGTTEFRDPVVKGRGLLRSIRVSEGHLYDADADEPFQPAEKLTAFDSTLLLYDFSDAVLKESNAGKQVMDQSGHGNHGTLHGAWWLQDR